MTVFYNVSDYYVYDGMTASQVSGMNIYMKFARIGLPVMMGLVGFVLIASALSLKCRSKKERCVVRWIFCSAAFSLLTQVLVYTHMVQDWEGRATGCSISPGVGTCTYILANTCMYLFLHTRAQAAAKAENDVSLQRFLKLLLLITYSSPLFCLAAFFLISGDVIHAPQLDGSPFVCGYSLEFWIAVLFLVVDSSLSLGYLAVFIVPVYKIMNRTKKMISNNSNERSMYSLVRQNLLASIVAISSTFIVMCLLSYGYSQVNDPSSRQLLFRTWTYPLVSIDVTINMITIVSITSLWMPKKWRRFFSHSQTGTSSVQTTSDDRQGMSGKSDMSKLGSFHEFDNLP